MNVVVIADFDQTLAPLSAAFSGQGKEAAEIINVDVEPRPSLSLEYLGYILGRFPPFRWIGEHLFPRVVYNFPFEEADVYVVSSSQPEDIAKALGKRAKIIASNGRGIPPASKGEAVFKALYRILEKEPEYLVFLGNSPEDVFGFMKYMIENAEIRQEEGKLVFKKDGMELVLYPREGESETGRYGISLKYNHEGSKVAKIITAGPRKSVEIKGDWLITLRPDAEFRYPFFIPPFLLAMFRVGPNYGKGFIDHLIEAYENGRGLEIPLRMYRKDWEKYRERTIPKGAVQPYPAGPSPARPPVPQPTYGWSSEMPARGYQPSTPVWTPKVYEEVRTMLKEALQCIKNALEALESITTSARRFPAAGFP